MLQWPNSFSLFSLNISLFQRSNSLHEGKTTGLCEHISAKMIGLGMSGFHSLDTPLNIFFFRDIDWLIGGFWSHSVCLVFLGFFCSSDQILFFGLNVWQLVLKWIPSFNRNTPFMVLYFCHFLKVWFHINQFCLFTSWFCVFLRLFSNHECV